MSKVAANTRKKGSKFKTANEAMWNCKDSALTDITKYLLKQPTYQEKNCSDNKVAIPSPNEVSSPCSTLQDLVACKVSYRKVRQACTSVKDCSSDSVVNGSVESNSACNFSILKKKSKIPTAVNVNSQITDFFQIRRSNRKTSLSKLNEKNQMIENEILSGKEEGFEIKEFSEKGRGVISAKAFKRGDFVLEYSGELIGYEEAKKRERVYSDKENCGCYMYYFNFQNKQYCIDATKETGRLGRLINHSKKGNLKTRTFVIKGRPHLVFFAIRDIEPAEELSYDYGDRRRIVLESYPWLAS